MSMIIYFSLVLTNFINFTPIICRIVKLERMGIADDKIITDLKYMIKKVCSSVNSVRVLSSKNLRNTAGRSREQPSLGLFI